MSTEIKTTTDDAHVGKTLTRYDDQRGTIINRRGKAYTVQWGSGETSVLGVRIVEHELAKVASHATSAPVANEVRQIVERGLAARSAGRDLRERARQALAEMDAIRAGLKPAPLTEADKQKILANIARNRQPMNLTPAEQKKILDRLNGGGTKRNNHQEAVTVEIDKLLKSSRRVHD